MDRKKHMKEWLKWAMENEANRKEAINTATQMISALNNVPKGVKLSDADIEKICGGFQEIFKPQPENCKPKEVWPL